MKKNYVSRIFMAVCAISAQAHLEAEFQVIGRLQENRIHTDQNQR